MGFGSFANGESAMSYLRCLGVAAAFIVCACPAKATDLQKIARTIGKEPAYQNKPKYALAVFGPEAKHKVWLVLDGEVLYVDKNGNGDLTEAGEKFAAKKQQYGGTVFKIGDITVGKQTYEDLEVHIGKLMDYEEDHVDSPQFQKITKADPNALSFGIYVDVPLTKAIKDDKGRPVRSLRHYVTTADANGILQFADRPAEAPILHFGGSWSIWPRSGQKLTQGRSDEFTAMIGTPGLGAGTFALINYHTLGDDGTMFVPKDARVALDMQFPGKEGKPVVSRQVLEDRC
jgi:hypothetical protein